MNDWQGWLYVAAVLIPLGAFLIELLFSRLLGRLNAYIATGAIASSCLLSAIGFFSYSFAAPDMYSTSKHGAEAQTHRAEVLRIGETTAEYQFAFPGGTDRSLAAMHETWSAPLRDFYAPAAGAA